MASSRRSSTSASPRHVGPPLGPLAVISVALFAQASPSGTAAALPTPYADTSRRSSRSSPLTRRPSRAPAPPPRCSSARPAAREISPPRCRADLYLGFARSRRGSSPPPEATLARQLATSALVAVWSSRGPRRSTNSRSSGPLATSHSQVGPGAVVFSASRRRTRRAPQPSGRLLPTGLYRAGIPRCLPRQRASLSTPSTIALLSTPPRCCCPSPASAPGLLIAASALAPHLTTPPYHHPHEDHTMNVSVADQVAIVNRRSRGIGAARRRASPRPLDCRAGRRDAGASSSSPPRSSPPAQTALSVPTLLGDPTTSTHCRAQRLDAFGRRDNRPSNNDCRRRSSLPPPLTTSATL